MAPAIVATSWTAPKGILNRMLATKSSVSTLSGTSTLLAMRLRGEGTKAEGLDDKRAKCADSWERLSAVSVAIATIGKHTARGY